VVSKTGVDRKPLGVVFLRFALYYGGAFCKKLPPYPRQKLFTLASQAALERFAQLSAAHGSGASRFIMGALFVKSSPHTPGKNFSRLLRKLLLSASRN